MGQVIRNGKSLENGEIVMDRKKIRNKQYKRDVFMTILYIRIEASYPSGWGFNNNHFGTRNFIKAIMMDKSFSSEKSHILKMPYDKFIEEYNRYVI